MNYTRFSDDRPLVPRKVRRYARINRTIAIVALILGFALAASYVGTTIDLYARDGGQSTTINNHRLADDAQFLELAMMTGNNINITVITNGTFRWRFGPAFAEPSSRSNFVLENVRVGPLDFTVLVLDPPPMIANLASSYVEFRLDQFDPPNGIPAVGVLDYNSNGRYSLPLTQGNINRMELSCSSCYQTGRGDDLQSIPRNTLFLDASGFGLSQEFYLGGYIIGGSPGDTFTLNEPWQLIFPTV